jgi:hypothetical protein
MFLPLQANDYQPKNNPVRIFARSRNNRAIQFTPDGVPWRCCHYHFAPQASGSSGH